jgi:hypothetical protein
MYIDSDAHLRFCPVVESTPTVISMLDHSAEEIVEAHREMNANFARTCGTDTCIARLPRRVLESPAVRG